MEELRQLVTIDYIVIAGYFFLVFLVGILLTKKASKSIDNFFVGGRNMSWWLIGISMAATNFSIDTPIAITKYVANEGIGGVWFFWASAISALLVTFLFARLWRRSGVITDAEIIESRYGGQSASALRLFKGCYFGIIFNVFIMGWVFVALRKVILSVVGNDYCEYYIWIATIIVFIYTICSGFYGVVLTDFIQYFIAFFGSIVLAIYALDYVGGISGLIEKLPQATNRTDTLNFFPSLAENSSLPLSLFLTYLLVQWWAHKYADGGGKHIQRMLSAKDENHSVYASLLFSFINYALQVWPWILTALCALIVFKDVPNFDPEKGYPMMMMRVLPAGMLGLVLVCLIGAFMSTIDTHLNLGASYIINDIYKRFYNKNASDSHYVFMSRVTMFLLLIISVIISLNIKSVGDAWKFLLTFASGAGLTWIVRWFWWRANAWTEFSGMITSGIVATILQNSHKNTFFLAQKALYAENLLITVVITTIVWIIVTYITAPVDEEILVKFVKKVRPGSYGWNYIYEKYDIAPEPFLGNALGSWFLSLLAFLGINFGVGSIVLGFKEKGFVLLLMGVVFFCFILKRLRKERQENLQEY